MEDKQPQERSSTWIRTYDLLPVDDWKIIKNPKTCQPPSALARLWLCSPDQPMQSSCTSPGRRGS